MVIQRQLSLTNSGKKLNVTKQPCHSRDQQRVPLLLMRVQMGLTGNSYLAKNKVVN